MKKLLAGAAVIVAVSQSAYAVDDQRILEVIKAGMSDMKSLCEKLQQLPEEDKDRLSGLAYGEPNGPAQEEIVKLTETHKNGIGLLKCISNLNSKSTGW